MVAEKVGVSQQELVSKISISSDRTNQYLAAIIATVGGLIAGTSLGWTSPTEASIERDFRMTKDMFGWISSAMPLGAILGSVITASCVNVVGRKKLMIAMTTPCLAGWLIIAYANSVIIFCTGRFLTGIATGSYCIIVPMYTAEIAEKEIRGTLGTYLQLQVTIGILLTYVAGYLLDVFTLTLLCAIIPVIYAVIMLFIPETPYFHMMIGNPVQAKKSLAWFRGIAYDGQQELYQMQQSIEEDKTQKVSFVDAFSTKAAKRALLIGLGVMFFQQFSGCNAVVFYTDLIFKSAGSDINSSYSTIIVGVVQVIFTYVATLIVDRLGRRALLLLSIVVMTAGTFALGLFFFLKDNVKYDVTSIGWLPLVSLCVYVIVFSLGFGPIPWMLMGEIFATPIKGAASSLACLFNWTCVFIVTKMFPVFVDMYGIGVTFWIFTLFCIIGIFFVSVVVPETKGKSLAEVQQMLGDELVDNYEAPFAESKVKV